MNGIEIFSHDGPARLGSFTFRTRSVPTPSACYLSGEQKGVRLFEVGADSGIRLAVPPRAGVFRGADADSYRALSGDSLIKSSYVGEDGHCDADCLIVEAGLDLANLPPARCLLLGTEPGGRRLLETVERLIEVQKAASPNACIIIPNALVWDFPLLALAGADIFCDSHAVECTLSGMMLFESYTLPAGGPAESCPCPHCSGGGREGDCSLLGEHNRWIVGKVLSEMRNRIRIGELKHLAEERAVSHPETMAVLKGLFRNHMTYLEEYTTVRPGVEP